MAAVNRLAAAEPQPVRCSNPAPTQNVSRRRKLPVNTIWARTEELSSGSQQYNRMFACDAVGFVLARD